MGIEPTSRSLGKLLYCLLVRRPLILLSENDYITTYATAYKLLLVTTGHKNWTILLPFSQ